MKSIAGTVIMIFAVMPFLYAQTDIAGEKTAPIVSEENTIRTENNTDGRVWIDAARGWVEVGTNFYPYSTGLNVGIGTMTPAYRLDVSGSMRITGLALVDAILSIVV